MSYEKAMKHARSPRKMKIRKGMHYGFDSCSGPTPSIWSNPRFVVGEWFKRRFDGDPQYNRECVREKIAEARAADLARSMATATAGNINA